MCAERSRLVTMQGMGSILAMGCLAYLGLTALVLFRQSRYVYYPGRRVDLTPQQIGLAYDDLTLVTADGERINAWFVPATGASSNTLTVLHCHGNAGDMGDRVGLADALHKAGVNVLLFDYRGFGRSTGEPTEQGTYADAMAVWEYLTRQRGLPPARILVHGQSLGGAVAGWLASQVRPAAVVLESTFTSAPDMARRMFPFLPVRWLCRFKYDTLSRMPQLTCPVLVSHSGADTMIPPAFAQKLFAAAREPKRFVTLNGGHNESGLDAEPAYLQAVLAFVENPAH